jgi:hypothetical protein
MEEGESDTWRCTVQYVFARVKRKRTVSGSMHDYNWVEMQLRWALPIGVVLPFIHIRERERERERGGGAESCCGG